MPLVGAGLEGDAGGLGAGGEEVGETGSEFLLARDINNVVRSMQTVIILDTIWLGPLCLLFLYLRLFFIRHGVYCS
jgi:hypothetical protein